MGKNPVNVNNSLSNKSCQTYTDIKFMFTNAYCLNNKMTELRTAVFQERPDIIAVCETWMQDDPLSSYFYPSECLQLDGFNLYRYDNSDAIRGGILLYIKCQYDGGVCKEVNKFAKTFEESAWHWITIPTAKDRNSDKLLFGCVYSQGASSPENNCNLFSVMEKACKISEFIMVCGDFNFPNLTWGNKSIKTVAKSSTDEAFLDKIDDLFLTQHVTTPTRISGNDKPSLLDLVFVTRNRL